MHPILLDLGELSIGGARLPLAISSYGVCYFLAIVLGYVLFTRLGRREFPGKPLGEIFLAVMVAGFLGGKLANLVVNWGLIRQHPEALAGVALGGGHFLGGVIVAVAAMVVVARRHRLDLGLFIDLWFAILPVGHAIGRIGCFLAGCCYGGPTDLPWAVTYSDVHAHRFNGTPLGVPLHPTQLYEALLVGLDFVATYLLYRRRPPRFAVFALWAGLYGSQRFLLEFIRTDERGAWNVLGLTLSTSQWLSLALVALAVGLYLAYRRRPLPPLPAPLPDPASMHRGAARRRAKRVGAGLRPAR